jgi:hypothetical protein
LPANFPPCITTTFPVVKKCDDKSKEPILSSILDAKLVPLPNIPVILSTNCPSVFKTSSTAVSPVFSFPIEKGMDISGSNDDRIHYEKIMQDAHVIFYFFDISKYFSEINYQRECNSRFEDLHKFFTVNKSRKKLLLFATHLDKCKGKKDKILFNFKDLQFPTFPPLVAT